MEEQLSFPYVPAFISEADGIRDHFAKRVFDIVFSLLVLIIGAPLFLLIGLLVRFSSKGVVIYGHERIGRGGKPFRCYKFRTMYPNAEARLKELLAKHPEYQEEWDRTHKLKNDPRITPIGRLLRKTSLDEFPQFFNALKGDMSIVGPRPVVKAELEKYFGKSIPLMLSIRPGLTGLWQISGRSDTSYEQRMRLDQQYVQATPSLLHDLKIIMATIPAMVRGAY
jgi:undecaprenyl-phosphate galactose phosphotransferase